MHSMNSQLTSPQLLAEQLGERLKQARLNQNITQEEIANQIGVNRRTVINAEKGKATLETLVAILQVLKLTDQLDLLLAKQPPSPLQLAKLYGEKRQRASGSISHSIKEDAGW